LPFTCERLVIEDVMVIRPRRFSDSRGYFVETYNKRPFADLGLALDFVQDNEALSQECGTLRGLHFQLAPDPQAKLIRVLAGTVFDVAVDLRDGSPSFGKWCGQILTATEGAQMFVPVGFAHAYCTLEPNTIVAYKVDGYYNKTAEGGIRWDDPELAIDWPISREKIKVSDRDASLPLLREMPRPFRFRN
jgi:dTDP-4-dehydrorhamnose 3,5-epimerase